MNLMLALVIAVIVFSSYSLFDQMMASKRRKESLRARLNPDGTAQTVEEHVSLSSGTEGKPSARAEGLKAILRSLMGNLDEPLRKLDQRFAQAGIPSPDAPIYYLFFQRIISIGLGLVALVFLLSGGEGSGKLMHIAVGLFITVIALFGPYLYLQNKIDHRRKKLTRGFPDTLDLLLICVESGLALDAALSRVCNELARAYPEMTEELNRTRLELALINDRVRALLNLGERTNMVAFRSLVAALIQSERFGTSLTDTLRVLSEDFRLMRLSDAEAKAARLPVLLTIPLIFLLMPAFLLIVLGPAIVSFVRRGQAVTGASH
jgi:tight adherence protein C